MIIQHNLIFLPSKTSKLPAICFNSILAYQEGCRVLKEKSGAGVSS